MKTIYKCDFTGKEFEEKEDCLVHEYENGGKQQAFYDLTDKFIDELEKKYQNIKVNRGSIKRLDELDFYIRDRIVHCRYLGFSFTMNGEEYKYYRTSDEVGDCRWNWEIEDNVTSFILDFEKEYIYPNMKVLNGMWETEWDYKKGLTSMFGELDSNYLFNLLDGKRVRIEILD